MERIVHIAENHQKADEWDVLQQVRMTPWERMQAALALKRRAYPEPWKDMRQCQPKP